MKSNPYDYINEVSDPALFAGRREELSQVKEEVSRLASEHPIAPMVAIVGERRVGKTSFSLRIQEFCESNGVLAVRVSLTDVTALDPWEFWHEIFYLLMSTDGNQPKGTGSRVGFRREVAKESTRFSLTESKLEFFAAYNNRITRVPQNHLVHDGLKLSIDAVVSTGQHGALLIIDEAHLLKQNRVITQQLRFAIREAGRCGVVFLGEPELAQVFADKGQPLFAQGRVIPLHNFVAQKDVVECALLPLMEDERPLVSPMTIDYLVKLSQGKPNQIRLICHSIYNRFQKGQQTDLNITIEALDDVLDSIAATYTGYDVRQQVETIRRLNSVDLETLYTMTRYPNWAIEDIVELDESFRAEGKSLAASSRREATLREKRDKFVGHGLMDGDPHKFTLAGDEFLSLYLRFWYEIRKYGQLSRSLVLGKGPATPFGEKIDKLVRFINWQLGKRPAMVMNTVGANDPGNDNRVETVRESFGVLNDLLNGNSVRLEENQGVIYEWFRACQLVRWPGPHHLLCLSVRNLENPRETMGIELFFDSTMLPLIIPVSTLNSLRQRADDARILIEGWDHFDIELPSLDGLLDAIGGPRLEELMEQVDPLERWRIASVQHHVGSGDVSQDDETSESDAGHEEEHFEWIKLYGDGNFVEADDCASRNLIGEKDRLKRARLYNDRGYIRYGLQDKDAARRDLQRALDLHFYNLSLTLSNLGILDIDDGNFDEAIEHIRDAMFLTLRAEDVSAGYLRLRLPTGYRARKGDWEQRPANVLEASYINLSFAFLRSSRLHEAIEVLHEGLSLMPSSVRLNHALARLQISRKRVDLAEPIYRYIAQQPNLDPAIAHEANVVLRSAPRQRPKRRRNK